ncbi:MAG TPA: alpha/beta hydrolase [Puia sp.]|nr:alpha/beta hydrolase [Puia sp.]
MKTVYCISGLGSDERVFQNLTIADVHIECLQWLIPSKDETIESYSRRMSLQIQDPDPILIGLSFGGMMAIEMAKDLSIQKIILVSSVKSQKELPAWMKLCGKLNLNSVIPSKSPKWFGPIANMYLGAIGTNEKKLAQDYRNTVSPVYLHWAVDKIVNWQNSYQPPILFHIHGTHDRMFPIRLVQPTHIVQGGGHFMIMNRADEISQIIQQMITLPDISHLFRREP